MGTAFNPGDRVRTKGHWYYKDHAEFTVDQVVESGQRYFVTGDPAGYGVWRQYVELVEAVPPTSEYNNPIDEAVIRRTEELQAVLRRRNEQISEQLTQINELRRQLDESTVGSALSQAADQVGLAADDAVRALDLGARLLVSDIEWSDINRWREQERTEELRVMRRLNDREKKNWSPS